MRSRSTVSSAMPSADDALDGTTTVTTSSTTTTPSRRRRFAAAAAGLGVAAGMFTAFAPAAEAVMPFHAWNRVAQCESGQRWHINTGNGYYGGLQFSPSTWRAYGGRKYAPMANRATRLQQIEVARRVLARSGPGAWPVCGPRAGLNRHTGRATTAPLPRRAGH